MMIPVRDWKQFIRMTALIFVDISLWIAIVYMLVYCFRTFK